MVWLRPGGEEARGERRCLAPVMAWVRGEREGFRRVEDIGASGFRLNTPLSLKRGQRVPIRLRFPDLWEEVELEARVAWSHRSGQAGFDLRGAEDDDADLLSVLIAHQEVLGRLA